MGAIKDRVAIVGMGCSRFAETFPEIVVCAERAYAEAGITDPRAELAMAEVHDCITATELVLMEDFGFSERGEAWKDVLAGTFDLAGSCR